MQRRFLPLEQLSDVEKRERHHRHHFLNLQGKDLKPLLRSRVAPSLRNDGFRKLTDTRYARAVDEQYLHLIEFRFSSIFPGRFVVVAGIAVDLVLSQERADVAPKKINIDTDCLLTSNLTLPGGNHEFDNGSSLVEAHQTIDLLIEAVKAFDAAYFAQFVRFPSPLDSFDLHFIEEMAADVQVGRRCRYGRWGATQQMFVYRIAVIQHYVGNGSQALALLQHGLEKFDLRALDRKYRSLLESIHRERATA